MDIAHNKKSPGNVPGLLVLSEAAGEGLVQSSGKTKGAGTGEVLKQQHAQAALALNMRPCDF